MENLTPEMIEKAKTAETPEALLELASANGVELTAEEAGSFFAQLNPFNGELSDDDLDNVSGGGCKKKSTPEPDYAPIPPFATHLYMKNGCPHCGICSTSGFVSNAEEDNWAVVCNDCNGYQYGSGRKSFWTQFDHGKC